MTPIFGNRKRERDEWLKLDLDKLNMNDTKFHIFFREQDIHSRFSFHLVSVMNKHNMTVKIEGQNQ